MKTQNNTINIQESDLEIRNGKNMIFSIIDNQINNYKLQALSNWEGNHNASSSETDRSIQKLKETKEALRAYFNNLDSNDATINLKFNLEVTVVKESQADYQEEELLLSYA